MNINSVFKTLFLVCVVAINLHIKSDSMSGHFFGNTQICDTTKANSDKYLFDKIIQFSKNKNLASKSLSEIEIAIAEYFIGAPYVANTLEHAGDEQLIINLREFDCSTFVENVVALSLCIKQNKATFDDFTKTLTMIRYRDGRLIKYPSRLHYFSDWMTDNEKKGIVTIVSRQIGRVDFVPKVNFMSTHAHLYKQLSDSVFVKEIASCEMQISKIKLKMTPKNELKTIEKLIENGDIIAITTSISGLDITHVGIAKHHRNELHFIHASSTCKKVVLSDKPLSQYLMDIKKHTGVVVCRLVKQ